MVETCLLVDGSVYALPLAILFLGLIPAAYYFGQARAHSRMSEEYQHRIQLYLCERIKEELHRIKKQTLGAEERDNR